MAIVQGGDRPWRDEEQESANEHLADENALLRASMAEMRERMTELEEQSELDPLTGLPNRRSFLARVERVIAHANRYGTPGALLYIDLEGLAQINERHGRIAGDAALGHAARLLSRLIRSTDVLARIGGDEFGLILDHLDHNSAIETAERLARCISANPLDLGGSLVGIAATIGTATILPGDTVDDVIQRADRNMYRAKAEG